MENLINTYFFPLPHIHTHELLVHSFLHVNNLPKWHLLLKANTAIVLLLVRWDQRAVQSSCRVELLISFSAITIICGGKEIAHQSEVLGKWPRQRPGAGCLSSRLTGVSRGALCVCVSVCVLSLITAGLKRARGVTPFILPCSSSSASSHTAGGLRTPSDHHIEAKVNLITPPPTNNSSPIGPLQESTFTPSPLGDVLASHSPHCVPFVHLLSWRLDCHWDPPLLCVHVCVCVAEVRTEAKITDNPTEHRSGYDTMEATQWQSKQQ